MGCMNFYDTLNSASRVSEVIGDQTRRHNEMFAAAQAEHKRQEKIGNAQLDSAEDLRRMLEMMEADQKEQAEENKKNRELALKSYKVSLAAAIFGGASFLAAFITLVLQWLG